MEAYQWLEASLNGWSGAEYTAVCSSGTAALHLALEVLQLPPGSEVLVPDFTMIACARAVTLAGLVPVFVDCDERLLMDLNDAEEKVTEKTSAIMPVHVYGRVMDMYEVKDFAAAQGHLCIVEDRAEAHGPMTNRYIPAEGHIACWSFYRNKIVAGYEGGALATSSKLYYQRACALRTLGFDAEQSYVHQPRGMNYRLSNPHAEEITKSLNAITYNLTRRTEVISWYEKYGVESNLPPREAPWVYDVRIPDAGRERLAYIVRVLNSLDIAARLSFYPLSLQQEYWKYKPCSKNALAASNEILYLPAHPLMTESQVAATAKVFKQLIKLP